MVLKLVAELHRQFMQLGRLRAHVRCTISALMAGSSSLRSSGSIGVGGVSTGRVQCVMFTNVSIWPDADWSEESISDFIFPNVNLVQARLKDFNET